MLAQIMFDAPPTPTEFQAELDPTLVALCLKALAKRPEDRYPSMRDFATALGDYLTRTPPPAAPPAARPDGATARFTPRPAEVELPSPLVHVSPPAPPAARRGTCLGWAVAIGAPLVVLAAL